MKFKSFLATAAWLSLAGVACFQASTGNAYLSMPGSPMHLGTVLPEPSAAQEILAGFGMLVFVQYIRRALS